MVELKQVADILDTGKVGQEELQAALQALLFHQCLYEDWPNAQAYRIVSRHFGNIQPIVGAFGYRIRHHSVSAMIVLETSGAVYGTQMSRLRKDETIVLLVLRLLYAEGVGSLDEYGRVEITTDDVHDRLRVAGDEPPAMPRLIEILKFLQRKGLVRLGERDPAEQLLALAILPGFTVLVPDVYVEAMVSWLETRDADPPPIGLLSVVAGQINRPSERLEQDDPTGETRDQGEDVAEAPS